MTAAENENLTPETPDEPLKTVRRLCSEIQLFDLCDLNQCSFREERFCTSGELLSRFERISDEDVISHPKPGVYRSEDEDDEPGFDDEYDDEYDESDQDDQDDQYEDD